MNQVAKSWFVHVIYFGICRIIQKNSLFGILELLKENFSIWKKICNRTGSHMNTYKLLLQLELASVCTINYAIPYVICGAIFLCYYHMQQWIHNDEFKSKDFWPGRYQMGNSHKIQAYKIKLRFTLKPKIVINYQSNKY